MKYELGLEAAASALAVSSDVIKEWDRRNLIRREGNGSKRLYSLEELQNLHRKYFGNDPGAGFNVLKAKHSEGHQGKVLEVFAGAGGMALGLKNAGLKSVLLLEKDRHAATTLQNNFPDTDVAQSDISDFDFTPYKDSVEIVAGGFPCQSFSSIGKGLGFEDRRGQLFFEFVRCIREIMPKVFIGENVRSLLYHNKGETLKLIVKELEDAGYTVQYKVLNAQYHDVAQKRTRLLIIGVRQELDIPILFPKENDYIITLREALHNCPVSAGTKYSEKRYAVMKHVPAGGNWRDLPEDVVSWYKVDSGVGGGQSNLARRLAWNEPSQTLTTSPSQKLTERCHPEEIRPLTIREYARIQSFPDSWEFSGPISSQYKQIGNAVPVNLAYHIGGAVIEMLEKENIRDVPALIKSQRIKRYSWQQTEFSFHGQ